MRDISAQEKRVFDYISRTIAEKGYSPSVRDIQKALSIKRTSTVFIHKADRELRADQQGRWKKSHSAHRGHGGR